MFRTLAGATLIFGGLLIGGCSGDGDDPVVIPEPTPGVGNSAYDAIFNNPDLSTLLGAIDAAGLDATLDNEANAYTIFAPNNAAFAAMDQGVLTTALDDPQGLLTTTLQRHVLNTVINAADATTAIADGQVELDTLNGTVTVETSASGGILVGGVANVVEADSGYDETTSVGVVHVIDAVLLQ